MYNRKIMNIYEYVLFIQLGYKPTKGILLRIFKYIFFNFIYFFSGSYSWSMPKLHTSSPFFLNSFIQFLIDRIEIKNVLK